MFNKIKILFKKQNGFKDSKNYWENRYLKGGNSGLGSYGQLALFKSKIVNDFIKKYNIKSVIEFGCGDGNQLELMQYPKYLGFDVSESALNLCKNKFKNENTKSFLNLDKYEFQKAELTLSLDVIFHLIEDFVFEYYMKCLFESSEKFVIIYSSNKEENDPAPHVKHRNFSKWIENNFPNYELIDFIKNEFPFDYFEDGSFSDFYIYKNKQK